MYKKSIILFTLTVVLWGNSAKANYVMFNPEDYIATINKQNIPSRNSAYTTIDFFTNGIDESNAKVVYYTDISSNPVPVYYDYSYAFTSEALAEGSHARISSNQYGANINRHFYKRYSPGVGGAIYNPSGQIGHIVGDFLENSGREGGAMYTMGTTSRVLSMTGDFINNNATGFSGGAIYNYNGSIIGENSDGVYSGITGNFIGNRAQYHGGAIANYDNATIFSIVGSFINNSVAVYDGGAIANWDDIINIQGDFISNYSGNFGGAIYNIGGTISNITGSFLANTAPSYGGAIYNDESADIGKITGHFIGNSAGDYGGAIYNKKSTISNLSGSFKNNFAKSNALALGGAIYTNSSMGFLADEQHNVFSGNYTEDNIRNKNYNAIFVSSDSFTQLLTFDIINNGSFTFNDNIEGGVDSSTSVSYNQQYDIAITGDTTGTFFLNNDVINANSISVTNATLSLGEGLYGNGGFKPNWDNTGDAITSLILDNAVFNLHNNYFETIHLKSYSSTDSFLHVNVGKELDNWVSDVLDINGDISGLTQVVVYGTTDDNSEASVLFVSAPQDSINNANAFEVYRVYGNPYLWSAEYNYGGEVSGSYWYLVGNVTDNPDKDIVPPPVDPEIPDPIPPIIDPIPPIIDPETPIIAPDSTINPEVIAYIGLHSAAFEQTRSMVSNVRNKVAANKFLSSPCGAVYDEAYNNEPLYNAWVNPIYHNSTIKRSVSIDSDILGLEAGFDIQHDRHNKLGIFFSYRKGDYDLNGKGRIYHSNLGSDIDIKSYMAGLYYRYDYRHAWIFATLYGGLQEADIKSHDGVKADSDGLQTGGSFELGYVYPLNKFLTIEPSLGLFHTQINFDNIYDNFGKSAKYKTAKQTELEASIRLEKYIPLNKGSAKLYIKPSVIQVISSDDIVYITGLGKVDSYGDGVLGRVEIGGRYAISYNLSSYGFIHHSLGSRYSATSFGMGLNYAW